MSEVLGEERGWGGWQQAAWWRGGGGVASTMAGCVAEVCEWGGMAGCVAEVCEWGGMWGTYRIMTKAAYVGAGP